MLRLVRVTLCAALVASVARAQDPAPVSSFVRPLVLRDGAPYVELDVGGAQGLFLVDTGANTSGVDRAWLEASGAAWRPGEGTTLGGTTGALRVDTAVLGRVTLGTGFFVDAVVGLQRFDHFTPPAPGRPQAGLLGTDLLARYQVGIDWLHERLEVRLRHERRPPPPGHEAVACAFPLNLPTVGVRVGGVGFPCRLDTGATYLRGLRALDVNVAAVEALRARGVALEPAGSLRLVGIAGGERLELLCGAGEDGLVLELGPARIDHVILVVRTQGTIATRHPLALASATLLQRLHRLVVDPFDHLLWVPVPEARTGSRVGPL